MGAAVGHCCVDNTDSSATTALDLDVWKREISGGAQQLPVVTITKPADCKAGRQSDRRRRAAAGDSEADDTESEDTSGDPRDPPTASRKSTLGISCESVSSKMVLKRLGSGCSVASEASCLKRAGSGLSSGRRTTPAEEGLRADKRFLMRAGSSVSVASAAASFKSDEKKVRLLLRMGSGISMLSRQPSSSALNLSRGASDASLDMENKGGEARLTVKGAASPSKFGAGLLPQSPTGTVGMKSPSRSPQLSARSSSEQTRGAVVALMKMMGGEVADGASSASLSGEFEKQVSVMSEIVELLEDDDVADTTDAAAPFADHCYYYNLELRGRRPKCQCKACDCGQVHERIPDDCFDQLSFPSTQSHGGTMALRWRFSEIDANNNNKLGKKELRDAVEATGLALKAGQMNTVMKVLDDSNVGVIRFEDWCMVGRIALQWYNFITERVTSYSTADSQELAMKRFFGSVIQRHQPVQAEQLRTLFKNAKVVVDDDTIARLIQVIAKDNTGCLSEPDILRMFKALGIIAHLVMPPSEADVEALGVLEKLLTSGVKAAFSEGAQKSSQPGIAARGVWTDGRGVSPQELKNIFSSFGLDVDPERMTKIIRMFDEDGNGSIEFVEFSKLFEVSVKWHEFINKLSKSTGSLTSLSEAELRREFLNMDKDGNGSIDTDELYECFQHKGIDIEKSDLKRVMHLADTDGNSSIEWPEFKHMFEIVFAAGSGNI